MNLEMQVTNLEISKKLKEIRIKQESLYYWEKCPDFENKFIISCNEHHNKITNEWSDCHLIEDQENYSAFTASELLDILPHMIDTKINEPFNNFRFWMNKSFIVESDMIKKYIYIVNYRCDTVTFGEKALLSNQLTKNIYDSNLANALGLMLIYLHENKLI